MAVPRLGARRDRHAGVDDRAWSTVALRARMGLVVDGAQPGDRNMGVELGGRQCRMAQELLHDAQIGATFEKVRGRAMP